MKWILATVVAVGLAGCHAAPDKAAENNCSENCLTTSTVTGTIPLTISGNLIGTTGTGDLIEAGNQCLGGLWDDRRKTCTISISTASPVACKRITKDSVWCRWKPLRTIDYTEEQSK